MRTVYYACLFCLLSCLFDLIHGKDLFRLPRDVFPTAYEIQLHPDFDTDNFTGEVRIVLTNVAHVEIITLHSANLTIEDVKFDYKGDITYDLDPENELIHISYNDKDSIPAGEHVLNIKFSGVYNAPFGVYKYSRNNNTFIATKFSTIFARRAFPCFDEPYFKATFNLRVLRPNDSYRTLSNMKLIRSYDIPSGILDEFQTTPIMSTYLLAFVITDLEYSETTFKQGSQTIPIRVFAEGTNKDREFVLNIAKKVMKYFRDYTDIDYPLPKVDLIELPGYASMGMEHWGLVCFAKGSLVLLKNSKLSRLKFEPGSALLIAHELSHFYFGDLVTHSWYSDLWLTEGFGRYMQYKALNSIYPEMDMDDLLQNQMYYLYYIDDLSTTLPIVSQVMKKTEIRSKYSGIVYPKGARILRMINYVIGEDKFKKAIRNYLRNNQYSAVSTGHFIKELQEVEPDVNMNGFVDVWLHENKYPIVTIREDLNTSSYILEQNCVPETKNSSVTICLKKWTIPIFYVTSENKMNPKMVWFDRDMDFVTIPKENEKWIKINHKEIAFYRTNYDYGLWQTLIENFKELSSMDKGHLIRDSFALFRSYNLSCSVPFSLIAGMRTEEKYIPWMFLRHTMPSPTMFNDPDVFEIISDYYVSLAAGTYKKLGWNVSRKDKYQTRFTRIEILELLCLQLKYDKCIEDFELMSEKNKTLHDDVVFIFDRLGDLLNQNETEPENINSTTSNKDGTNLTFEDMISECSDWVIENLPQNTLYNATDGGDSFHSRSKDVFPIIITVLTIFYCITI